MCFSAEASFGASAVITTVGVISWVKSEKPSFKLLALIPIMFGIQQFFEGMVWVSSTNESFAGWSAFSTNAFIVFAWIVWPFYIPFVVWKLEKDKLRKKILLFLMIIGLCIVSGLFYLLIFKGVHAKIQDCSILYQLKMEQSKIWLFDVLYIMTVVGSHFISSTGYMWLLGGINLLTYFFSKIYFKDHMISVWCFFAAISSIVILYIIIDLNKKARQVQGDK